MTIDDTFVVRETGLISRWGDYLGRIGQHALDPSHFRSDVEQVLQDAGLSQDMRIVDAYVQEAERALTYRKQLPPEITEHIPFIPPHLLVSAIQEVMGNALPPTIADDICGAVQARQNPEALFYVTAVFLACMNHRYRGSDGTELLDRMVRSEPFSEVPTVQKVVGMLATLVDKVTAPDFGKSLGEYLT